MRVTFKGNKGNEVTVTVTGQSADRLMQYGLDVGQNGKPTNNPQPGDFRVRVLKIEY